MKKTAILTATLTVAMISPAPMNVQAAPVPNPIISRDVPAYSGSGSASSGNDAYYFTLWNTQCPDYLAYDLSGVPEENRQVIDAVWYCISSYDMLGQYYSRNMEPSGYTIEVNATSGGDYPENGWEVVETVTDNTLSSRQHIIDFAGYNWIRINISQADGKENSTVSINFDIHDVSQGVSDSWLFLGDSITAGGMNNCYGTGFATYVHQLDVAYFPVQENGGIGGIRSTDGLEHIDGWLSTFPGQYVSIAYGTNDAWGNQTGAEQYYENTKMMIDKILALGKVPVLPKIPGSINDDVQPNVPVYNEKIEQLWEEYGDKIVKGPDFQAIMEEHPEYLSGDGVHPSFDGYEEMRRIWAETMYERVYSSETSAIIKGDVNKDGQFDVADVVLLQKWLLAVPDTHLADWKAADFCEDDLLDVFDFVVMKRELIMK